MIRLVGPPLNLGFDKGPTGNGTLNQVDIDSYANLDFDSAAREYTTNEQI